MLTTLQGDALVRLGELPTASVHCCVTSPPYWGLRDYGVPPSIWGGGIQGCTHTWQAAGVLHKGGSGATGEFNEGRDRSAHNSTQHVSLGETCAICGAWKGCLGLEPSWQMWVEHMVDIFREVRRVLRPDGTLWLNVGDCYAADGKWGGEASGKHGYLDPASRKRVGRAKKTTGLKPKDLVGLPWRLAFALQEDGWWLRMDNVWHKRNPMPESVTDRPTRAHEYMFLLTPSAHYYYDAEAVKEPCSPNTHPRGAAPEDNLPDGWHNSPRYHGQGLGKNNGVGWGYGEGEQAKPRTSKSLERESNPGVKNNGSFDAAMSNMPATRNLRSVWTLATQPYHGAHYATFPPELVRPCVLAGTSAFGCCAKCGTPWERVMENPDFEKQPKRKAGKLEGQMISKGEGFLTSAGQAWQDWRQANPSVDIGWKAACKCIGAAVIPCTVLDPFGGSGTTGQVALELGRRAILIELGEHNMALVEERCDNIQLPLNL